MIRSVHCFLYVRSFLKETNKQPFQVDYTRDSDVLAAIVENKVNWMVELTIM